MPTDYIVRLKCPFGDHDELLTLQNRKEDLREILKTAWGFRCPAHGRQIEIPLEGNQKTLWTGGESSKPEAKAASPRVPRPRSTKRISLHVPVLVSGWSKNENSFHEETLTILVNASGALLALDSRVALGDTIFITNKATQQEQECRVAYVETDPYGKLRVGAAFKNPAPEFWKAVRREVRVAKKIRVKVQGLDRSGHPFVQSTHAVEVSRRGALLEGIGYLTRPGETVQVKCRLRSARFRVVWVGEAGMPQAGCAGIFALEPNKNIWGVSLP